MIVERLCIGGDVADQPDLNRLSPASSLRSFASPPPSGRQDGTEQAGSLVGTA
jgi:hypothetical protein